MVAFLVFQILIKFLSHHFQRQAFQVVQAFQKLLLLQVLAFQQLLSHLLRQALHQAQRQSLRHLQPHPYQLLLDQLALFQMRGLERKAITPI
ncbi:MAG: hypothetical protein EBR82_48470 [Caulobacteraceae bacterium]|nr:hypothetical protein [Caulobacteraceae bacterium]